MPKFFVSLGNEQKHVIDDHIWDKDSVLQINAETAEKAEQWTKEKLEKNWAMLTTEEEHCQDLYPKGVIGQVTIK